MKSLLSFLLAAIVATGLVQAEESTNKSRPNAIQRNTRDFQRDVVPLLRKHFTECHGNKDAELELNLTTRESLLKGASTGAVITPDQPTTSRMIQMLAKDADEHMPPGEDLPPIAHDWDLGGVK